MRSRCWHGVWGSRRRRRLARALPPAYRAAGAALRALRAQRACRRPGCKSPRSSCPRQSCKWRGSSAADMGRTSGGLFVLRGLANQTELNLQRRPAGCNKHGTHGTHARQRSTRSAPRSVDPRGCTSSEGGSPCCGRCRRRQRPWRRPRAAAARRGQSRRRIWPRLQTRSPTWGRGPCTRCMRPRRSGGVGVGGPGLEWVGGGMAGLAGLARPHLFVAGSCCGVRGGGGQGLGHDAVISERSSGGSSGSSGSSGGRSSSTACGTAQRSPPRRAQRPCG